MATSAALPAAAAECVKACLGWRMTEPLYSAVQCSTVQCTDSGCRAPQVAAAPHGAAEPETDRGRVHYWRSGPGLELKLWSWSSSCWGAGWNTPSCVPLSLVDRDSQRPLLPGPVSSGWWRWRPGRRGAVSLSPPGAATCAPVAPVASTQWAARTRPRTRHQCTHSVTYQQ